MGAGLSKKQFKDRVYRRLKATQRELQADGIKVVYKNFQLYPDTTGMTFSVGFNISYRRLDASNGETAGLPRIIVQPYASADEEYGWWNSPNGDWDKGIARIKELFKNYKETTEQ